MDTKFLHIYKRITFHRSTDKNDSLDHVFSHSITNYVYDQANKTRKITLEQSNFQ